MKKLFKIILYIIGFLALTTIIDLIFINIVNRPIFAIKENNDSTTIKYIGLFFDTYNCIGSKNSQIKAKNTKFTCPIETEDKQIKNITTNIYDISLTGATILITDNNIQPYVYSQWYKIEKEENGIWKQLAPINNNYGFNEMGYLVDDNNQIKFVIDWQLIYVKLSIGSYRIVKEVSDGYIYIPFNIATTS